MLQASRERDWCPSPARCQFGYRFMMPLLPSYAHCTVLSRDWVSGSGYRIVISLGFPRTTNAILIMISVTSALSAPWLSLFPAEGNMEDKELTGPQVMWKSPSSPLPSTSPCSCSCGDGVFLPLREDPFSLTTHSLPAAFVYFLHTSLVGLAPFFPMKCVLDTLGFAL